MSDSLTQGRAAFERHAWSEAFSLLKAAERESGLGAPDLSRMARAAHLTAHHSDCEELFSRAHSEYLEDGEVEAAAECAFWLGFKLMHAGEHARGGGWLARAERILEESEVDSAVRGLLLLPSALRSLAQNEADEAFEKFSCAHEIGRRFGHKDLLTLSRLGTGQSLIRLGKTKEGVRLLDEVMVDVTAGDASPVIVGIVYCAVIAACHEIFDLRRAQEWTAAFSRWCEAEPDVVPFRGECLIRRAEIMQLHGQWADALEEALRAGKDLTQPPAQRAAGAAYYRQADIHRLKGQFDAAEQAFREAERWGRSPQPGLALLRLAQGRKDAAATAIRHALNEAGDRRSRTNLLPAAVEILLEADDVEAARAAADELGASAEAVESPYLEALALCAEGSVRLAEDRPREALSALRKALTTFRELPAPYESARTLVMAGLACRALGEEASCELELGEARRLFERLQAAPDLERLARLSGGSEAPGGLTPREIEVLGLVATGMTNHAIADRLFISEKTVARHLSNIFNKLGISSRAAATAFAYESGLV